MADENDGGAVDNGADVQVDPQQFKQMQAELQAAKARLKEFRDNNTNLLKERDEKWMPTLEQTKAELEEARREAMKAKGDVEGVYKSQIETLTRNKQKEIDALAAKLNEATAAWDASERSRKNLLFTDKTSKIALVEAKAKEAYLEYITADAAKVFDINDDGEFEAKPGMINTKTGAEWTFKDWILSHRESKPDMYQGSSGGGAVGGGGAGFGGVQTVTKSEWARKMGARNNEKFLADFRAGKIKVEG